MRHLTTTPFRATISFMQQSTLWQDGEPKFTRQMTVSQFDAMFPDEQACWTYLLLRRWPVGPKCPRCNNDHVYESTARPWHWQCKKCGQR